MDEITEITIRLIEGRRNVVASALAAHHAGQAPLAPDEVARFGAEIGDCDAELAELRKCARHPSAPET